MIEFGNILRDAGLTVAEVNGWRNRSHPGSFTPVGIVWHHTGGLNALPVVLNGRADLAGPLANLYLDKGGTFHVVASGVAWHAGPGNQQVLDNVRKGIAPTGDAAALGLVDDCSVGNHFFIGIEVENLGTVEDPYPPAQLAALIRGSAALCRALGYTAGHCIHHREWTDRKVDMSYRGNLRDQVDQLLKPPASSPPPITTPPQEDDMPKIVIDAPGRPKALLERSADGHLARVFTDAEWQAFYRVFSQGKVPGGLANLVIETRPVAEYDALVGGSK